MLPFSFLPSATVLLFLSFVLSCPRRLPTPDHRETRRCPGGRSQRPTPDSARSFHRCSWGLQWNHPWLFASAPREQGCGYLYFANNPLSRKTMVAWSPQSGMAQTRWFTCWGAGTARGSWENGWWSPGNEWKLRNFHLCGHRYFQLSPAAQNTKPRSRFL